MPSGLAKQMASDLATEFRLVALDIRGHGFSEKPLDVYSDSRLWADDVQAVITTLDLARPVLVGWSYGGAIICDYLRFYGEDQIGGINFVGAATKLGKPGLPLSGKAFLGLMSGLFNDEVEKSVAAFEQLGQLLTYYPLPPEEAYLILGYSLIVPPYVREACFRARVSMMIF